MSSPAAAVKAAGSARRSGHRWLILGMLFITVVINYMDRANLSISMPHIADEFHLSTVQEGFILSAFGWTYAALQVPGGWIIDRVKPRVLYPVCLILWSLSTFCMGLVGSFIAIFVLRLMVGVFEAPAYPINNKVATMWFPEKERASAIGIYTSGQFIGLAVMTPVLAWILHTFSWRAVFMVSGVLGLVWATVWYFVYRNPKESPANDGEISYIRDGNGLVDVDEVSTQVADKKFSWQDFRIVVTSRKLWGLYIGQFCLTSTMWFFLTWFPTYLVKYRHMDFIKTGFLASLPFIAAMVGVILAGVLSDALLRKGMSVGAARKIPIVTGLVLSTAMGLAVFTDSIPWVIAFMSIAFFGNGFASITWSLVSAIAPSRLIGLSGGMFNFIGNLSSVATPIVIGALVTKTDFTPAFVYMTVVTVLGIVMYTAVVGRVSRVSDPLMPANPS